MAVLFEGSIGPNKELKAKYVEVLGWVTAMVKKGYVAGTPDVTLADLSFVSTFSTLKVKLFQLCELYKTVTVELFSEPEIF